MTTFGELQGEVGRLVRQTINGDFLTDIKLAINDAVNFYSTRALDFNEGFATTPTVVGQAGYDLPSDLLMITHAQLFWGNSNYTTLIKRNWQWYLDINQDASNLRSVPSTYYAINRKKMFLYPTPAQATSQIETYYILKIDPLVGDDDTNVFLQDARLLIRSRALYDLYTNRAQNAELALSAQQFEQREYTRLTEIASANLGSETIEPFQF